ncbi:MAG: nucleotidyltransferase, partial [Lachnospiraceae bacterium]|nr:nucleotidyltransferase [Lachnospiraceae bacterium]
FEDFLGGLSENELKREYLLPTIIGGLLENDAADVEVRQSSDEWFGVTYKEDKDAVVKAIRHLIAEGVYPEKLF